MELQEAVDIKQLDAVKQLASILRGNLADFFDENNQLIDIKDLSRKDAGIIKKIKVKTHHYPNGKEITVTEIELYDKLGAIDRLCKMLNWIPEDPRRIPGYGVGGVIVIPEGSSLKEQWDSYVALPDGSDLIRSSNT